MRSIRMMNREDTSAVAQLEAASFKNPWSEQSFLEMLEQQHISCYVAEEGNIIQGFAIFSFLYEEGELLNIAVAPEFRQQHIGTALLEVGVRTAILKGVCSILLEVRESNLAAIRFYAGHQFQKIGIRKDFYEKPREHAVVMRRNIEPASADSNSH